MVIGVMGYGCTPKQDCYFETYTEIEQVMVDVVSYTETYYDKVYLLNNTFCIDFPLNLSCKEINYKNFTITHNPIRHETITQELQDIEVSKSREVCV